MMNYLEIINLQNNKNNYYNKSLDFMIKVHKKIQMKEKWVIKKDKEENQIY